MRLDNKSDFRSKMPHCRKSQRRRRRWQPSAVRFAVVVLALMCAAYVYQNQIILFGPNRTTQSGRTIHAGYICSPPGRGDAATTEHPIEIKILVWTRIHGKWNFGLNHGNVTTFECTGCHGSCYVTNDRLTLNETDAVLFHGKDIDLTDIPLWRSSRQKYVYWSMEPPTYTYIDTLKQLNNTFNWTMTYRLDSDVLISYGKVTEYKEPQAYDWERLHEAWRQKSKMAVWAVSNCLTPGKREHYVFELQRHVDVDVYGLCGNKTCPRRRSAACYRKFSRVYFFYLSFENSICEDYVTEKLFQALKYDIIPVVFGGGNYSRFAPPGSYVDALGFSSPKELADHMRQVASNFSLYAGYFRWKQTSQVTANEWKTQSFCSLCHKLHSGSFEQTMLSFDPFHWWVTMSGCRAWKNHTRYIKL